MKVLIAGANGQLGKELQKQLSDKRISFLAVDIPDLDIVDFEKVDNIINTEKPDIIINCAAYTNVDGCESNIENAFKVNAIGSKNLALAAKNINSKIVYLSTDYVFDGQAKKPYREYDQTNPQSIYGKSKLLGEDFVQKFNPQHFIIRTAWLYGDGHNFVRTMLKLASEKDELNIVDDQVGSPTSTVDLAKLIINLLETEHYGLYHGTCEESCSWYDFARKIFEIKGIKIKLNRVTTEELNKPAPRPQYSVLDNFMLRLMGLNTFRNWEDALGEYLRNEG